MKVRFILPVTTRKRFSLLCINVGLVRMYVTPYRIFWIIFTSDLVISYNRQIGLYSDGYKLCSSCSRFVLFCFERDFMTPLSDDNQADIVEAFNL